VAILFSFKKKLNLKIKKPKADMWHAVNGVCEELMECTTLMYNYEFGY